MEDNKVYKVNNISNINMTPGDPNGLPDESYTLVFIDEAFLSKLSKHFLIPTKSKILWAGNSENYEEFLGI